MAWTLERARYADKMRHLGRPLMVTQEEFAAAARLLEKARQYGMSDLMIGEQAGVHYTLASKVRRGIVRTMHRDTFDKVMSLKPERPGTFISDTRGKVGFGPRDRSPVGTVRRVQGLRADGFPGYLLGGMLGVSYEAVAQIARLPRGSVLESTRLEIAKLYAGLEGKRPEDFGIRRQSIDRCKLWAGRAGYVPRSCWDDDTIDDPDAQPEWTGHCGTAMGRAIHDRDDIPLCPRCGDAPARFPFSGERLRELRESRGLTQRRLEELAGLSRGHVHHWENGRYAPRPATLTVILLVLDATFDDVSED